MAHSILQVGLASWAFICYVAVFVYIAFCRHAPPRNWTSNLLTVFSVIRIIGCFAQLATVVAGSETAEMIAAIADFSGLSPLLLAALDILSRVSLCMLKNRREVRFGWFIFTLVQVPAITAFFLCITGVASGNLPADVASQDIIRAGVILYLDFFILLATLAMGTGIKRYTTHHRGEDTLFYALAMSLPFLLLRLLYSVLLVFSKSFQDSVGEATLLPVLTELFMARAVEIAVVLIFLISQRAHNERINAEMLLKVAWSHNGRQEAA